METHLPFQFETVKHLQRETTRRETLAVLPEMANISEHTERLPGGGAAQMRRYDPGAGSTVASAAVFMGGAGQHDSTSQESFCRFLAEALGLPVISIRDREGEWPMDRNWITSWWHWCSRCGQDIGLDPTSLVLLARGEICGSLLNAVSIWDASDGPRPVGLFLLCGNFIHVDVSLVRAVSGKPPVNPQALPPTYIATSSIGSERAASRRMSAYLLNRQIECWYVEWPGVTAQCLDNIERVPEMERYIDAMVITLRGLLAHAD